jgi:hypothetical protein
MKKISNNDVYSTVDTFSQELRAQPRKSDINWQRTASHAAGHHEENIDEQAGSRHSHRSEPSKNLIRVQLRRIQQLF